MKFNAFFFLFMLFFNIIPVFSQVTFEKTFGGILGGYSMSFSKTNDEGYIFIGNTVYWGTSDIYVIKTNLYGTVEWAKTYGGDGEDRGYSIQQTFDGGYIMGGRTKSFTGEPQCYLIKTDSLGSVQWSKIYGGTEYEDLEVVYQTSDSGYLMAGTTSSYGMGVEWMDVYVIKVNSMGDTLWTRTFGGESYDYAYSAVETNDGGHIILGVTANFGAGGDDMYIIKLDKDGKTLWIKTYGGINSDVGFSINKTMDNGFIIAGQTFSFGAGSDDAYLVKIDSVGTVQWAKTYGSSTIDFARSAQQTIDGGYVLIGGTFYSAHTSLGYDVYVIKTDSIGDTLWTKLYGGYSNEERAIGYQTSDGGYIIAGETASFGNELWDWKFYLLKINEYGNKEQCNGNNSNTKVIPSKTMSATADGVIGYGANVEAVVTQEKSITVSDSSVCTPNSIQDVYKSLYSVKVYPNPANDYIIVEFGNEYSGNYTLNIYDITGVLIKQFNNIVSTNKIRIKKNQLNNGIYLFQISNGENVIDIKKVIIY